MQSICERQLSNPATYSKLDLGLDFDWVIPTHVYSELNHSRSPSLKYVADSITGCLSGSFYAPEEEKQDAVTMFIVGTMCSG